MTDEQKEYNDFWKEVTKKSIEIQQKYNSLSMSNKQRADAMVQRIFQAANIQEAFKIIRNLPH